MCNSNNLLYTPKKHEFRAYRADGTQVHTGDVLGAADNEWIFSSCTHPRKIYVGRLEDPNGPQTWPNKETREFYASVFDLGIYDVTDAEWTFVPNWRTSDIDAKLYEEYESRNLTDADVWASYDKNVQKGEKIVITPERPEVHQTVGSNKPAETDMWDLIDKLYQRVTKCDGTVILTPRPKTVIVDDSDSLDEADKPWVSPGPSEADIAAQADRVRRADKWVETGIWDKPDYSDEEVKAGKEHELHMLGETDIADDDDKAELIRESDEQAEIDAQAHNK